MQPLKAVLVLFSLMAFGWLGSGAGGVGVRGLGSVTRKSWSGPYLRNHKVLHDHTGRDIGWNV